MSTSMEFTLCLYSFASRLDAVGVRMLLPHRCRRHHITKYRAMVSGGSDASQRVSRHLPAESSNLFSGRRPSIMPKAWPETLVIKELFQALLARLPLDQPELFLLGSQIIL